MVVVEVMANNDPPLNEAGQAHGRQKKSPTGKRQSVTVVVVKFARARWSFAGIGLYYVKEFGKNKPEPSEMTILIPRVFLKRSYKLLFFYIFIGSVFFNSRYGI